MLTPPGIRWVLANMPAFCAPMLGFYVIDRFLLRQVLEIYLPISLTVAAYSLSFPVLFALRLYVNDLRVYARANSVGAVFPRTVHAKLPGSLDLVVAVTKEMEHAYPCEIFGAHVGEYGNTFNLRMMFVNRIVTTEPQYIKTILATGFEDYEKGETFRKNFDGLLGSGVFNSDGDMWKLHRGMARPFFSKDRISHFDIFDRHADDLVNQLKTRLREGHAVDIQDAFSRFTLDSATEFLFGNDVGSLSVGLVYPPGSIPSYSAAAVVHPADTFSKAFLRAQVIPFMRLTMEGNWPLFEFWEDKLVKEMEVVSGFIDPIVGKALEEKKAFGNSTMDSGDAATFLEHLVKLTDDAKIIKDEALNVMIAARDTTTVTLTFMMSMLSQHPHILQRLREEIIEKLGSSQRPSFDDLRDMKYLRAVINETLRLFPPVPANLRYSRKDSVWPSLNGEQPLFIPAGTSLMYSVFLMHRRTDLWGPDANEFDPDRFLDHRLNKYLTPNPFIFLPFNAGPRICLGQQFAYNEISFMTIKLLQSFSEISWAPDACPDAIPPTMWANSENPEKQNARIWLKSNLTMYAHNGFWVRMKEADGA